MQIYRLPVGKGSGGGREVVVSDLPVTPKGIRDFGKDLAISLAKFWLTLTIEWRVY